MFRNRSSQFVLAAVLACIAGTWVSIAVWGSGNFIPGLVGNFAASLAAFMLALAWERDREIRRVAQDAKDLEKQRGTEVRRRFASVRAELEKNAQSLEDLTGGITAKTIETPEFQVWNPQLLEGAWSANAPQLSELVADYDLIGDLAITYGRIEELRWRLRYRTEHVTKIIDAMTEPLIAELRDEVADLLERVAAQIDAPSVQPLGLHHTASFSGSVSATASLETKVTRASESGSEEEP